MTPEQWQRVKDALATALSLDATGAARTAYLAELKAKDPGLHEEVTRLLAAEAPESFLESPVVPAAAGALPPGTRIGSYEVTGTLGAGGMGEVYRALDTRLKREVALKILPEVFAEDPERLARFRREAEVLASLNHPNIAAIYGLEDAPSEGDRPPTHALVLELVEGPTLADRILKGPIPVQEAVGIARQIAEALEAAHHAGVIHRDLKPLNIKLREDGGRTVVKVLDFGLAKLAGHAAGYRSGSDPAALTASPTITTPAHTQQGVILGTAAYMSPEQAKGRADAGLLSCRCRPFAVRSASVRSPVSRRSSSGCAGERAAPAR